jgi:hypothetical protein
VITQFDENRTLASNVSRIATNVSSFIHEIPRGYQPVAFLPIRRSSQTKEGYALVFAVALEGESLKFLVMADHSVFINSMMLQDDNDNFAFASNCVNWITDNGRRNRVLFLDDGEAVRNLDVSLTEIPGLSPQQLRNLPVPPAEAINNILAAWEDDNIHNRLIVERFSRNEILRPLVVGLTIL